MGDVKCKQCGMVVDSSVGCPCGNPTIWLSRVLLDAGSTNDDISVSAKDETFTLRPISPREERILKFFAEKWREWSDKSTYDGYFSEAMSTRHKCANDIDNFMVEEFESAWSEAKVEK